ncbi:TPA: nucleotidyltransferase family protein [Vibrio cholerae]
MFEAVILAGGMGTRLKSVSGDIPKPMVDVNGKPFLYRTMQRLEAQGCSKIVLSLCYKADYIMERINIDKPVNCQVIFTVEESPLGTGGAIKLAASKISADKFVALNGDTHCEINYIDFLDFSQGNQLAISGVFVDDVSRYGSLILDSDNNVLSMKEKGSFGSGVINSGIYVVNTNEVLNFDSNSFSFEEDFFQNYLGSIKAFLTDGLFIDIGIPEDYYKACKMIK